MGDCFDLIKTIPNNSVDLVITSPPYVDIVSYGKKVSITKSTEYCDWILPLFDEIWRVLKPSGSFILNINDKTEKGYRTTFIEELIYKNSTRNKLLLYDKYFWHKKSGIPNGAPKRFRNMTEYIFHFCKDYKQMKFYMDRVLQEPKDSSVKRYDYEFNDNVGFTEEGSRIRKKVKYRHKKSFKDGQANHTYKEKIAPEKVRPDNVFRFNTASASKDNTIKHPAPFHKELPLFFIELLTDEGDLVIDTFSGIATTGIACKELKRDYIGFELNEMYATFSEKRLSGNNDEFLWVNQYDLNGTPIKSYYGWAAAEKETGLCGEDIMRCYSRQRISVGGYYWRLENFKIQI